uniref:Cyclin-dependent kinases regulatory subunit n=1 Tax=Panagrellus redivivus TaxID=6233 RepID=A0A7E4W5M3_PANRE
MSQESDFFYSDKYEDDKFEYRHVHVPRSVCKLIPKDRLLTEAEWRNLGIQQSPGWEHYMIHGPERHILLFRRPLPAATVMAKQRSRGGNKVGICG